MIGNPGIQLWHGQGIADKRERLLLMTADLQEALNAAGSIVQWNVDVVDTELLDATPGVDRVFALARVSGEAADLTRTPFRAEHRQDQ